jgi:DNA polymerase-3 subunit beta
VVEIPTDGESFDFSEQISDMNKTLHAVDVNNPKYELNGIFLEIKDGVFSMVSTDTKRLASVTSKTNLSDNSLIIPKKAVENMIKLFGGLNLDVKIDKTTLSVYSETMDYSTKLIAGKYPDWKRIVPQTIEQTVSISRKGLQAIVKEAAIFESEIIVRIANGKIIVTDINKNTEVSDTFADEEAKILFAMNSNIILDFLASYDDEVVQIGFNGTNAPLVLIANPLYKEVAMPLMMEDEEEMQKAA